MKVGMHSPCIPSPGCLPVNRCYPRTLEFKEYRSKGYYFEVEVATAVGPKEVQLPFCLRAQ